MADFIYKSNAASVGVDPKLIEKLLGVSTEGTPLTMSVSELNTLIRSYPGPTGPQGPAGTNGVIGHDGADGPTGPTGPQGPAGNDGTGISVKSSREECVETGDAYIDTDGNIQIYNKDTGRFTNGGQVKGPQGNPGRDGTDGTNGDTGPTGPTGPKGDSGVGDTGPTGPTGPVGPPGAAGLSDWATLKSVLSQVGFKFEESGGKVTKMTLSTGDIYANTFYENSVN